jgi:hypothetical protein
MNATQLIATGDIIEFAHEGEIRTGLVLLSNEVAAIIDLCDDSTPVVLPHEDLMDVRVFHPLEAVAA